MKTRADLITIYEQNMARRINALRAGHGTIEQTTASDGTVTITITIKLTLPELDRFGIVATPAKV